MTLFSFQQKLQAEKNLKDLKQAHNTTVERLQKEWKVSMETSGIVEQQSISNLLKKLQQEQEEHRQSKRIAKVPP